MTHTLTLEQAEAEVRAFALEFDTPNVRRAVMLAESGRLSWFDIYTISREALATANATVSS